MNTPSDLHRPFLRVENIRKSFSGVQALDGVDLSVDRGEIVSLIGENGSGKSTLIKIMAGVLAPDSGRVWIEEREINVLQPRQAIRKGIQVIYQDFSLFPNLTVAENISLGSELAEGRRLVRPGRFREIAEEALSHLAVDLDGSRLLEELPVAQQQIVAICRALVQQSRLIIMDEPTAALTRKEIQRLYRIIRTLKEHEVSVLFVSHKLEEVLEISDRIAILRGGKKVLDGAVSQLDTTQLVQQMTGRSLERRVARSPGADAEDPPLLQVIGLTRKGAYREIDFELYPGEIAGITGLLGSGQSELGQGLFGLLPYDRGKIFCRGRPLEIRDVSDALKAGFAFLPEDRLGQGLFLDHTVRENLMAGSLDRLTSRFHLLRLDQMSEEAESWIEQLRIVTDSSEAPVRTLSGGNQQRVVLGRWLATGPRFLILNNPTAGVDVGSKYDIHELLRTLAQQGNSVLIISDDLPELLETCQRILVMSGGRIRHRVEAARVDEAGLLDRVIG